jgi:hypothetical protein
VNRLGSCAVAPAPSMKPTIMRANTLVNVYVSRLPNARLSRAARDIIARDGSRDCSKPMLGSWWTICFEQG